MIKEVIKDEQLVSMLKAHQPKSIELAYEKYGAALYGCILQWVKDEGVAATVLEKTFIELWHTCQHINCHKHNIFCLMYSIARRLANGKAER
ncbi:hypothetical protein [Aridibaculum aurantiacum]|uniref:hypothetical protein n=1 Tax=Aridibaculum aurantiacum TaxID=2810307 RepID=UPI001A959326|nr:hypothetical protein [Aridibaculum aurantiacum]